MSDTRKKRSVNKGSRRWTQEDIAWGKTLAGHYSVTVEDDDDWDEEGDDIELLEYTRETLLDRLRSLVPEGATPHDVVPGATEADLGALIAEANDTARAIAIADLQALTTLRDTIGRLELGAKVAGDLVRQRTLEKQRIGRLILGITAPDGAEEDEQAELAELKRRVAQALTAAPLTDDALRQAGDALADAQRQLELINEAIAGRRAENERIAEEGAQVTGEGHLQDQKDRLSEARNDLADALEPPITMQRNRLAADALDRLKQVAKEVADELDSLGGAEGIANLCEEAGIEETDYVVCIPQCCDFIR